MGQAHSPHVDAASRAAARPCMSTHGSASAAHAKSPDLGLLTDVYIIAMASLARVETARAADPLRGHAGDAGPPFRLERLADRQAVLTVDRHAVRAHAALREASDLAGQLLGRRARLTVRDKP